MELRELCACCKLMNHRFCACLRHETVIQVALEHGFQARLFRQFCITSGGEPWSALMFVLDVCTADRGHMNTSTPCKRVGQCCVCSLPSCCANAGLMFGLELAERKNLPGDCAYAHLRLLSTQMHGGAPELRSAKHSLRPGIQMAPNIAAA